MKERPILFSAPMVRAILAGTKTQTRRLLKAPAATEGWIINPERDGKWWPVDARDYVGHGIASPYGLAGDRLWVRETLHRQDQSIGPSWPEYAAGGSPRAAPGEWTWKRMVLPAIHMPRWASRITLEVTDVRVERLRDISKDDACAEGIACDHERRRYADYPSGELIPGWDDPRESFRTLWQSINRKHADWLSNPYVWVISFRRIDAR